MKRCELCDGTGDVHSQDGEWRGECPYCHDCYPICNICGGTGVDVSPVVKISDELPHWNQVPLKGAGK